MEAGGHRDVLNLPPTLGIIPEEASPEVTAYHPRSQESDPAVTASLTVKTATTITTTVTMIPNISTSTIIPTITYDQHACLYRCHQRQYH